MTGWEPSEGPGGYPDRPPGAWHNLVVPIGPLPRWVYWRRRFGLLAVLVFLAAVLATVAAPGAPHGNAATATPPSSGYRGRPPATVSSTTPVTRPRPLRSTRATTRTPPPSCQPAALSLQATTDADIYPAGVGPRFLVTVGNPGRACRLASDPDLVVTSGSDRVWSNRDCSKPAPLQLAHGSQTLITVWERQRSDPGCDTPSNGVTTALPGYYHLTVAMAGHTAAAEFALD